MLNFLETFFSDISKLFQALNKSGKLKKKIQGFWTGRRAPEPAPLRPPERKIAPFWKWWRASSVGVTDGPYHEAEQDHPAGDHHHKPTSASEYRTTPSGFPGRPAEVDPGPGSASRAPTLSPFQRLRNPFRDREDGEAEPSTELSTGPRCLHPPEALNTKNAATPPNP